MRSTRSSLASLRMPTLAALSAATVLLMSGCAVLPGSGSGKLAAVDNSPVGSLPAGRGALSDAKVPSRWWTLFGDDTLSALEAQAAEQNLDLISAGLRLEQSRAQLGLAQAAQSPSLAATTGFSRSAIGENTPLHALGASTKPYDTWNIGLQSEWEVDLWGYLRSRTSAAASRMEATAYEREGARVSLSAEVARTYVMLRGIQAQERLLDENLQVANDLVRMAESRQRNGVATRFDAAAAKADVATIRARLLQLRHQRDVTCNGLALLLALPPQALDERLSKSIELPMPAKLPVGLASDVASRRPDILRADAQLRATLADIGAAKADFYPRVRLTGRIGMSAFELGDLDQRASREFSIGPSIYLPIFQGGRLQRNVELSEISQRQAAIAYRQTLLRAWHEIDDALNGHASEQERHEQLALSVDENREALLVAQRGYQQGISEFTAVLVARRALLASQSELATSATAAALSVVSLYRALGGGWSDELAVSLAGKDAS